MVFIDILALCHKCVLFRGTMLSFMYLFLSDVEMFCRWVLLGGFSSILFLYSVFYYFTISPPFSLHFFLYSEFYPTLFCTNMAHSTSTLSYCDKWVMSTLFHDPFIFVCPFVWLFVYLPVFLSACLSVCMSVSLFLVLLY